VAEKEKDRRSGLIKGKRREDVFVISRREPGDKKH
jgi:hypothetical protein